MYSSLFVCQPSVWDIVSHPNSSFQYKRENNFPFLRLLYSRAVSRKNKQIKRATFSHLFFYRAIDDFNCFLFIHGRWEVAPATREKPGKSFQHLFYFCYCCTHTQKELTGQHSSVELKLAKCSQSLTASTFPNESPRLTSPYGLDPPTQF